MKIEIKGLTDETITVSTENAVTTPEVTLSTIPPEPVVEQEQLPQPPAPPCGPQPAPLYNHRITGAGWFEGTSWG